MNKETRLPQTFFTAAGAFLYENEIVEVREKAIKVKTTSFVAYPGVTDKVGRFLGFAWLPKKAIKKVSEDTYKIASWVKINYTRG